jgi:menaquinone-9 beta-reductase
MSTRANASEYLVVGGVLAGSMAAIRLADAGREVVLLEKERAAHDKVCGEFLSGEAVDYLRSVDVEPLDLGASAIHTVRLSSRNSVVECALPFPALSLSRKALDDALLARASRSGCEVLRGAHVESINRDEDTWLARVRDKSAWHTRSVFLACGKHDLNGFTRNPASRGDLVGFKLHWRLSPAQTQALNGAMELFLFTGGYGGLSLVEDGVANLCLVVKRNVLRASNGWTGLLDATLAGNGRLRERLRGAAPLVERPLAIFPIPYGYLAGPPERLWRIGDQAAVIPSFTGDGMSIALHSGALAARMAVAGRSPSEYQFALRKQLESGMRLSQRISSAMLTALGRTVAPIALSLLPASMARIASSTRIPASALAANTL